MLSTLVQLFALLALVCLAYGLLLGFYRLTFHPLSNYPGPKLAAITYLYERYYDVLYDGSFIWRIEDMHRRYGPIVRINPGELHIKDSDFFGAVYASAGVSENGEKRKICKDGRWVSGAKTSAFGTADHDLHRLRRSALNPFFAKRMVENLEPRVASKVMKLLTRFAELSGTGNVVNVQVAATAFATDVITEYCFGEEACSNYLDDPDFMPDWASCMRRVFDGAALRRAVPWVMGLMKRMPVKWIPKLMPSMEVLLRWRVQLSHQVDLVVRQHHIHTQTTSGGTGKATQTNANSKYLDRAEKDISKIATSTMFHTLLSNPSLSTDEKSLIRLTDEAEVLVAAGTDTTARTISYAVYYVLATPGVLVNLRKELKDVWPSSNRANLPRWIDLEKLPYLTGVVKESLRLSFGVTTRSPRIHDKVLAYKGWIIPPGTTVSCTTYFISTDPDIFPRPFEFRPSRWLDMGGGKKLDKYLTNFSRGTRGCVGINLAYCELYLVIAAIFRNFELELFETTYEDVRMARDKSVACPSVGSKGVRVIVKRAIRD